MSVSGDPVIHDALMACRKCLSLGDLPEAIRCLIIAFEALEEKVTPDPDQVN